MLLLTIFFENAFFLLYKKKKHLYLHRLSEKEARSENIRAVSSVGSEHLVYTQGVGGSNPSPPTPEDI